MNTKLQAPENLSGFSYQGVPVELDEDGTVVVSNNPAMVAAMLDHGFTEFQEDVPVVEEETGETAAPKKRVRVRR